MWGRPAPAAPDPRGKVLVVFRRWPDGLICSACSARAMETYGRCEGCHVQRLLPGIGPDGQRWCTDCAGGIGDFTCRRCGAEGWIEQVGTCGRCVLSDRITAVLDDGTGRIRPELAPLAALVTSMPRPRSGILWLSRPQPVTILRQLATGHMPITHDALLTAPSHHSALHIRDMLVTAGVLPPVDRFLTVFENWWPHWLKTINDDEHRKLLHRFTTWHLLRRMRRAAAAGPISYGEPQRARRQLRKAAWLLTDLAEHGRTLSDCRQADIDRIHAHVSYSDKQDLRPFLNWATTSRHMPRLVLPQHVQHPPEPISQHQRIELLRRIHHDRDLNSTDRVLAMLILLYAQPLSRIQRLTIDDITDRDGRMTIRLGDPPSPVPPPFDGIVRQHLTIRATRITVMNSDSPWLFPGRSAGQPLHITSMRLRLRNQNIPNVPGRTRAIRELLRQAPPAIVAGMLNYGQQSSQLIAERDTGATWKHYAAGDHQPTSTPHPPA